MTTGSEQPLARDGAIVSDATTRALNLTSSGSTDVPATKQFAVNATGNIFIATTCNGENGTTISAEAEQAFGQVSVFFAALTKAMSHADNGLYD